MYKRQRVSFVFTTTDPQDVIAELNAEAPGRFNWQQGYFRPGENAFVDAAAGRSGYVSRQGQTAYVQVQQQQPARPMTLGEARGQVLTDYQQFLEKQWQERLRKRFPVVVNESVFQQLK